VTDHERTTTAQGQRRRNVRLALIIAGVAVAVYFGWWLKVAL
jgi:hypothetical protein